MNWRLAKSLEQLRAQVNAAYPNRSKTSDGTIGDARHAASKSDHNPTSAGVVTAIDITHDPAHGVVIADIAEVLRKSLDPRIKYVICNGRIFSSKTSPWVWRPYTGTNAHSKHIHVSVMADPALYDDTRPWALPGKMIPIPVPKPARRFTGITATVFSGPADHLDNSLSAYGGATDHNKLGVALPFKFKGTRPKVRVFYQQKGVVCDIVDVGPWNIDDDYWNTSHARPQAETGTDRRGRRTNLAGIDLTPATARKLGLVGKAKVDWEFVGTGGNVPGGITGVVIIGGGAVAANEAQKAGYHPALIGMGFALVFAIGITAFFLVRKWMRK